ncbi:MAG TPA: bifunctional [glutamate--ammonia ligase]-adenylyl-L-tyrosine phosphorylase/[glutamate--ammonia-ligase] adenylyltransferase [Thermodesulfobacteriota bacterium]|nr:bifunctional [glutamate--ammonia ligase]-adenylyl-L-tyrosine phosphorylase/[glutamate--ammonia-ligase] adenylyltransferase [Thermodesulfobacteriota bacterium]
MSRFFPDPENAENLVKRFKEQHKKISSTKKDLLYLLSSHSNFIGRAIIKDPKILDLLLASEFIEKNKLLKNFLEEPLEIARRSQSTEEFMSELRRYKYRELSRIIYRDIEGRADFPETMEELSDLASGVLEAAFRFFRKEVEQGANRGRFVVIGMGKFGGRELNLSSDIDLIYLYQGTERQDVFFKLAERITKSLSAATEDGFLYRVDLGLRPGGAKGDIAISLEGALEHYFYWGDTWERAALIKARPVAGDLSLGEEFIKEIEPFVYKKYLDYASIEDLKDMKTKLDRLHKKRDVKLGKGGIREIEFFVQALQLVNGGAVAEIRERSTLQALEKLSQKKLAKEDVCQELRLSYLFLRKVEHGIQLVDELQTHSLPHDPVSLDKFAKRVGFKDKEEFEEAYNQKTSYVSKIYEALFYEPSKRVEEVGKEFWELADFLTEGYIAENEARENLKELGFRYPDIAVEIIGALLDPTRSRLTQRGRSLMRKVIPAFLSKVIISPDPDAALRNLERFVSGVSWRTSIYAMLAESPEMLELLSRLFSTSGYLSSFLIKHPEYLDVLTLKDSRKEFGSKEEMLEELYGVLSEEKEYEDKLDAIRRFRHVETLKLCLRDLNREVDPMYVGSYLSMLAETVLEAGLSLAGDVLRLKTREKGKLSEIAIIGMGKLGGMEMSYNSDLDIIFIYKGNDHEFFSRLGQRVISILSIPTSEGYAYKIDTQLRPSGRAGALVSSLESFRKYHEESAKLWERQALIRARPCAGNEELGKEVMKTVEYFVYKKPVPEGFHREIHRLRTRMEKELAKESNQKLNLKVGRGGIVDIEFLVQMLQLRFGGYYENVRKQNTLRALEELRSCGLVDEKVFSVLADGLRFLKKLENLLRLLHGRSISELYESDFHKLAFELGMKENGDKLREIYVSKTGEIRRIYDEYSL